MDGFGVGGYGSFFEGFRKSRVGVVSVCNIFVGSIIFECKSVFSNYFISVGVDDVDIEKVVGFRVGENFDEFFSVEVGFGMGVGVEGESVDVVGDVGFFEVLFRLINLCNFGEGVYDGGNVVVVDVVVVFFDVFDNSNSFFFSFVCKYGVEGGVIDVVNVGDFGVVFGVDNDMVVFIEFEVDVFKVKIVGIGVMINSNKDDVSIEL